MKDQTQLINYIAKFQRERRNTINIAKFQDDQVRTLKACHQPASIAPTVVISNSFNEQHVPKDIAVQPSHVHNSACAAQ